MSFDGNAGNTGPDDDVIVAAVEIGVCIG